LDFAEVDPYSFTVEPNLRLKAFTSLCALNSPEPVQQFYAVHFQV